MIQFANPRLLGYHYKKVHGLKNGKGAVIEEDEEGEVSKSDAENDHFPFYCCQLCYCSYKTLEEMERHKCKDKKAKAENKLFDNLPLLKEHNR